MPLKIGFAKDLEFTVDSVDNLMVEKGNNWNQNKEILLIGPLTNHLIDSMQECLEKLRTFAKD